MTNILLAFVVLFSLGTVACFLALFTYIHAIQRMMREFVTPIDEKTPSPLALAVDAGGVILAKAIAAQFKTTFMGMQSGDTRANAAIGENLMQDTAPPLVGALLSSFPALRKTLRRNPALLDMALSRIMQAKSASAANSSDGTWRKQL